MEPATKAAIRARNGLGTNNEAIHPAATAEASEITMTTLTA